MNIVTKRVLLATLIAVVVTVSVTFAIMYVTRGMDAQATIMVWLSVIGVMMLAYFITVLVERIRRR